MSRKPRNARVMAMEHIHKVRGPLDLCKWILRSSRRAIPEYVNGTYEPRTRPDSAMPENNARDLRDAITLLWNARDEINAAINVLKARYDEISKG